MASSYTTSQGRLQIPAPKETVWNNHVPVDKTVCDAFTAFLERIVDGWEAPDPYDNVHLWSHPSGVTVRLTSAYEYKSEYMYSGMVAAKHPEKSGLEPGDLYAVVSRNVNMRVRFYGDNGVFATILRCTFAALDSHIRIESVPAGDWEAFFDATRDSPAFTALAPLRLLVEYEQWTAALHRNDCTVELVDEIARWGDRTAATHAVRHPLCPPAAFDKAASRYSQTFCAAWDVDPERISERTRYSAAKKWATARHWQAGHEMTPVAWLREWWEQHSGYGTLAVALAQNPNTPTDIVDELALSGNAIVSEVAVNHPNCSQRVRVAVTCTLT